ncbi:MAG: dihydroorotate dehydrogenase electron transfer subunit [Lachnospiraceae bacterium]|nr:dihydroorotate dehydrogenase electron transfer subunit [Lachnospiraceae bacterium]
MNELKFRKKETAQVVSQKEISEGIFDLRVKAEGAKACCPGQFAGIFPPSDARLLLRPISICECDKEKEEIRFVYRIAGEGTRLISVLKEGDEVEILSVLGNGFPVETAKGKKVALMGGGIGIPPMLYTARMLKEISAETVSFMGYRNADTFLLSEFESYGKVLPATEDGSVGVKGNVMDALRESGFIPDIIMACGPMPMLRAIKKYAEENNITAYISLEERMACGVGACLGCVAKTTHKDDHSHVNNTRICTEGPVFDAKEVEI